MDFLKLFHIFCFIFYVRCKTLHQNTARVRDIVVAVYDSYLNDCIVVLGEKNEAIKLSSLSAKGTVNEGSKNTFRLTGRTNFGFLKDFKRQERLKKYPRCFKTLVAVFGDDDTKHELEQFSQTNTFSHSLWLFFMDDTWPNYFDNIRLTVDARIIVIQEISDEKYSLTEVYGKAQEKPLTIVTFAEWSPKNGLNLNGHSSHSKKRSMSGIVLKTTYYENWPISSFTIGEISETRKADGLFIRIWEELEDLAKFQSDYFQPSETRMGTVYPDGNSTGLIKLLDKNIVDAAVFDTDVTSRRQTVVDFMQPILSTRFQIYFRADGYIFDWFGIFKPLTFWVWLVLLIWIMAMTAAYAGVSKVTERQNLPHGQSLSVQETFFMVLQAISGQSASDVPRDWACQILFFCCYFTATVVIPSYSAALVSTLTQRPPFQPFNDLEGALSSNYWLTVGNHSGGYEFLLNYGDKKIVEALKDSRSKDRTHGLRVDNIVSNNSRNILADLVCSSGQKAHSAVFTSYHFQYSDDMPCEINRLRHPVGTAFQSISLAKNSPYLRILNYNQLRLNEVGLINRYKNIFTPKGIGSKKIYREVAGWDVAELFIFLLTVAVVSVGILFWERQSSFQENK